MAKVRQRTWSLPGQRTKRKAWGYVTVEPGKHRRNCPGAPCRGCHQIRQFKAEWSKEDAEAALAAYVLKVDQPKQSTVLAPPLSEAAERYLAAKSRKRTVAEDRRVLEHLKAAFGPETRLSELTGLPGSTRHPRGRVAR